MENAEYVCCVMKIKEKEIVMELDQIMKMLKGKTEIKLVKFVSDKGPNSCEECLKHHGEIFQADDPDKPELTIHPNCRCKYELMTQAEVISYQENVQKIKTQLNNYGNQIAAQATQLLAECDREIKTQNITHSTYAVMTALPAVYQTMKIIEKGKNLEEKVASTVTSAKLTAMVTTLQIGLWTMKKIEQADNFLQEKMESIGIYTVLDELKSWLSPMQKIEDSLKKWHYDRLNNPMQQSWALPQSPEEAIRRGFVRAPDSQNLYHRNKEQKDNEKYHSPETGQEVIFNGQGKIVTDVENIGTYNYFPPSEKINDIFDVVDNILHMIVDVMPYYEWGNEENDTTPFLDRVAGPDLGPKLDSAIKKIFSPEDPFENIQKNIDEMFKKYRKKRNKQ